ncbi:flagellar hook basal body protein FliE [Rhizobium gallicum bv. gallicum R602sp]|uniref:Flagellar hook-basal body complex protein FliE n=1 Tax=Rhizobium gallicum bv. gallicum R602sp TaxID=1041138 RepID=A0A0B4WX01_9HYPH|nr:flagellar hook-basal body complex protein FliE [Rhizobium gallicum]AJD40079.1 flagellar hook basal body protein FliE [Rhizobium gallicum bv. gallicum R602sp]TDW36865.1 flagellar hook-basal body complex protein FliE [Rhizobium azibense]
MINTIQNVSSLSVTRGLGSVATENSSTAPSAAESAKNDQSFAAVLGNMATQAVDTMKGAESMSFAGIKGTATTREVVDSMLQAEQTLQTAIAIRDKVVSAFLEVTKMQM